MYGAFIKRMASSCMSQMQAMTPDIGNSVTPDFRGSRKGQTMNSVTKAAVGMMVAVAMVFVLYIFIGNLAPEAQNSIEGNDSYPGQAILENNGVLFGVLGGLIAAIVLIFRAATSAQN